MGKHKDMELMKEQLRMAPASWSLKTDAEKKMVEELMQLGQAQFVIDQRNGKERVLMAKGQTWRIVLDFKDEYQAREVFNDINNYGWECTLSQHTASEAEEGAAPIHADSEFEMDYSAHGFGVEPAMGMLELVGKYVAIRQARDDLAEEITSRTGMGPEAFISGMSELLAPAEED